MSIYDSLQGKEQVLKLYDQNWAALGSKFESSFIDTRYGKTHVVATGLAGAQPIIVFHGGNMISPISFAWFVKLANRYRIYAPDTVGHPGRSAETRLNPRTFQYGQWAADVIARCRAMRLRDRFPGDYNRSNRWCLYRSYGRIRPRASYTYIVPHR